MKLSLRFLALFAALIATCVLGIASAAKDEAQERDYTGWAIDPTAPGPDLPPAGRSLFDHLIADRSASGYRIAFPFWTFVDRIRERLAQQEYAGGTRATLIPMGRSLQRAAAVPNFFLYPRAVVAITGEPLTTAHDAGMLLKDRLYIGYVESTNTLEVISYNETAGRFEFQLVKDYREGGQPKVFYANRAICTACHQNQAPIFSQPVWSETTANGRVATLLGARLAALQLPRQSNLDFPDDINKAAVRSNAIPALQRAWQDGCSDAADRARSRRCRAAAFTAVLQYGLTGERDFDTKSAGYGTDFVATAIDAWRTRWPAGLLVPQSDLQDRNPLGGTSTAYGGGSDEAAFNWAEAAHVPASLDPLNPRPPRETWHFSGSMDAPPLIAGWSKFFATDDYRALNAYLIEQRVKAPAEPSHYRGDCNVTRDAAAGRELRVKCVRTETGGIHLAARLDAEGKGRIEWVDLGPAGQLRDVPLEHAAPQRIGADAVLRASASGQTLAIRLPDGRALAGFEIRWPAVQEIGPDAIAAQMEMTVTDDFRLVRSAIERLLRRQPALFDEAPLARARLMRALFAELGMPDRTWCCVDDQHLLPAQAEEATVDRRALAQHDLQPFFRYCSVCHLTRERFPPNFLAGDARQVADKLRHCAPRMLVRLAAWQSPPEQRTKTPMPPATAIQALGTSLSHWASGAELEQMRAHIENLMREQGRPTEMAELLKDGYETLPGCLE
jgi:hypothetical protein